MNLTGNKSKFIDNEYTIMSEIVENENVTQRQLSKKLGISVSTVNVLMNKMIREGLIKMTQVSQKQVLYMLTPAGMIEKANKTVSYLKAHYRAIYEMKEKIKLAFEKLLQVHDAVFIFVCDDGISEILYKAVKEFQSSHTESNIKVINQKNKNDIKNFKAPVLVYMIENKDVLSEYTGFDNLKFVNLSERI